MKRRSVSILTVLSALALGAFCTPPARAQSTEVKEKPPMYSYVGQWNIPRAKWADMQELIAVDQPILEKALANGTLVAYGNDMNLVHTPDGATHDDWWSSMSMAGILDVLDQFFKARTPTNPALASATKHWDNIFVSRYYNWHSGAVRDGYTHGSSYNLKPDAPPNALETLSKYILVPFFEKLLADGTIVEYEIDTEVIHTESPNTFWIYYITTNAEGLDKANAALREGLRANPLEGPTFGSMVDMTPHRDALVRTNATYK